MADTKPSNLTAVGAVRDACVWVVIPKIAAVADYQKYIICPHVVEAQLMMAPHTMRMLWREIPTRRWFRVAQLPGFWRDHPVAGPFATGPSTVKESTTGFCRHCQQPVHLECWNFYLPLDQRPSRRDVIASQFHIKIVYIVLNVVILCIRNCTVLRVNIRKLFKDGVNEIVQASITCRVAIEPLTSTMHIYTQSTSSCRQFSSESRNIWVYTLLSTAA